VCRVVNEHIGNLAGLLDDQKRQPNCRVGAQIRLPALIAAGWMKTR
jgi:hypothetical protein